MTENNSARPVVVTYEPRILRSIAEICKVFGVGRKTVQMWVQAGAPIAVEGERGKPRYSTECCVLQAWRIQRNMLSQNDFKTV